MTRSSRRTRGLRPLALTIAVALLASACGYDNPGEPRTPAEKLAAPNLGDVHVYCVEREYVVVTVCEVALAADAGHSPAELRGWWLRAARALHRAREFAYKDGVWRFGSVFIDGTTHRADGNRRGYGWRCPEDRGHSEDYVSQAMTRRNPGGRDAITTLAAAQKRGCTFALEPDLTD
jgi:hypothetical protein